MIYQWQELASLPFPVSLHGTLGKVSGNVSEERKTVVMGKVVANMDWQLNVFHGELHANA